MDLTKFYAAIIIFIVFQIKPSQTYGQRFNSISNNYFIDAEQKYSWFDSLIACIEMNMTLVTIDSSTKSNEVSTLVQNNFGNVKLWIGGIMSRYPSRHFIWLATGSPFLYTNWQGNNPDFYGNNEYCVHIGWGNNLQWNDNTCSNSQGFICEDRPQHQQTKQLQQELEGEKKKQQELLQRLLQKAKAQLELQEQMQQKQAQQEELMNELEQVKETSQEDNQKHLQLLRYLKDEIRVLQDKQKEDINKFYNIEQNLKDALEKQQHLQQELDTEKNLKDHFQGELQKCMEKQQTLSNATNKKFRDIILHFHQNQ